MAGKMLLKALLNRLTQLEEESRPDSQFRFRRGICATDTIFITSPEFCTLDLRYQEKFVQIPELLCDGTTATMLANSSPNVKPECVVAHTIFFLFPVAMLESNEYLMLFDIY